MFHQCESCEDWANLAKSWAAGIRDEAAQEVNRASQTGELSMTCSLGMQTLNEMVLEGYVENPIRLAAIQSARRAPLTPPPGMSSYSNCPGCRRYYLSPESMCAVCLDGGSKKR